VGYKVSYLFGGVNMAGGKTVYAFHITPKIWLALTIIAAVFAGIFCELWAIGCLVCLNAKLCFVFILVLPG